MDEIFIREIDGFPKEVEAVTVTDANGDYNIYFNRLLPECRRKKACTHELRHILLGHFESCEPLILNEFEAEKIYQKKKKQVDKSKTEDYN